MNWDKKKQVKIVIDKVVKPQKEAHMIILKLQFSPSITEIINSFKEEGYIELDKFIENSISNHIDNVKTEQRYDNISHSVPLEVKIPILLALRLWWKALITKTSVSNIVNEALAFSIPLLLEQDQEQEDYRLEVELDD